MTDERRGWVDRITSIVAGIVGGEANRLSPSTGGSGRPLAIETVPGPSGREAQGQAYELRMRTVFSVE